MKVQKSLEINFHGPISFHICKDVVWAYLPKCRDHVCNVLTDMNDISPKRRMVFELVGPTPASTKNGGNTLLVQRNWNSKWGPKPQKCYCVFKLPSPDLILVMVA